MGQKLIIGPISKGLKTDLLPFNIDNDSFPVLENAYQWRGRVKRKRGTSQLGRLNRQFDTQSIGNSGASPWNFNLLSSLTPTFTLPTGGSITPGSVQILFTPATVTGNIIAGPFSPVTRGYTIAEDCEVFTNTVAGLFTGSEVTISGVFTIPGTGPNLINRPLPYTNIEVINANTSFKLHVASNNPDWGLWQSGGTWSSIVGTTLVFTDDGKGNLVTTPPDPSNHGTINYLTGAISLTHTAGAGVAVDAAFSYYPALPVMGLEDLLLTGTQFPGCIAFDTTYAYNISTSLPYPITDISFYSNPIAPPQGIMWTNYAPKSVDTPLTWNGNDYQQFWSTNYQSAFWATNGIPTEKIGDKISMQYAGGASLNVITYVSNTATTLIVTITNCPLVIGDFVFVNEWTGTNANTLNFQSGYVTACNPNTTALTTKTLTITFPNAAIGAGPYVPGIIQYLTNSSITTKDSIRYYDGVGWVNFCPPLSQSVFSISEEEVQQYYLVSAKMIIPFKDHLLFLGPVIQTSGGTLEYLQDTALWSQNGTPYYTASFAGTTADFSNPTNMIPILVPDDETADFRSYWEDQTGFGASIPAGVSQAITTAGFNEDALIVGFSNNLQTRFIYTGNEISPFGFFSINVEFGSNSTFSAITMDDGVITRGPRGFIITSQTSSRRIDLDILPQAFQIQNINNGSERFCAQRDYENEWIYFTYLANNVDSPNTQGWNYPSQTLLFNYRDNSWAIFNESYTTYGLFRKQTGFTWETVGTVYPTWERWNDPWEAGSSTLLQPEVIAGNQQGFVMVRQDNTDEEASLAIISFSGNIVTSYNHNLNEGDYIVINNCIGTIAPLVNGQVFSVFNVNTNTFQIDPSIGSGTYTGAGTITRLYLPFIQTKQFPTGWGLGRKTRIGLQQYLLSTTPNAQITLLMFLSQDSEVAYNDSPIVPANDVTNNSLIYSTILYTCPESTNLGLTPFNSNLQMLVDMNSGISLQAQTWHRMNTSLIGDTVQLGLTMSDLQMRTFNPLTMGTAITGASNASSCVLQCTGAFAAGTFIQITGVKGMPQFDVAGITPSKNIYYILSSDATTVTINVNTSTWATYISGGLATPFGIVNQVAEIELHAAILDLSPASVLA